MPLSKSAAAAAVVAAPVVFCLGLALLALRLFARTVIFPGCADPFPSGPELVRRIPGATIVPYAAPGGPRLAGVFVPASGEPGESSGAPVVVWFHGNAESAAGNLPLAADLSGRGLGVFLPEVRGYGGFAGRPSERGLVADGEAALAALERLDVARSGIVLVGRSLGTGVAAALAVRRPPALLVLVSPFTSAVELGRGLVGALAPILVPDRFDTLSRVAAVRAPVVVFHGTADEVIPVEMGRRVAVAAPLGRFEEIAGATHNEIPDLAGRIAGEVRRALYNPRPRNPE